MKPIDRFLIPERQLNAQSQTRKVGFELEFAGISPEETAEIVAKTFGGSVEKTSEAEYHVENPDFDAFRIELDWEFGRSLAKRRSSNSESGIPDETDTIMKWMTSVAGQLVPTEIVCPPIPIDQLERLNLLVTNLRDEGALGTEESFLYAFGLHINPEIPDHFPVTIVKYLQSFVLCQRWLQEMHRVDISRRISPYIELFSDEYANHVLGYTLSSVTVSDLIEDYLRFNPTRNRALDMLPLFKYLDSDLLESSLGEEKINSRPTFHYRLPNCEIGKKLWTLMEPWSLWAVVEFVAHNDEMREGLTAQWQDTGLTLLGDTSLPWHFDLVEIYNDLLSA